jgi:hypothetical protein
MLTSQVFLQLIQQWYRRTQEDIPIHHRGPGYSRKEKMNANEVLFFLFVACTKLESILLFAYLKPSTRSGHGSGA